MRKNLLCVRLFAATIARGSRNSRRGTASAPVLLLALAMAGCSTAPEASPQASNLPIATGARQGVPELAPGVPVGYLAAGELPDSLALLPPPPARGSAAMANDEAVRKQAAALRGTPRYRQATLDADLGHGAPAAFACALDAPIDAQRTPRLYQLLARTLVDAGLSTQKAKTHHQRTRPFVAHGDSSCTPHEEAALRKDGSYPSGHTTIGWAWALVLAEVAPERADAILARGRSFGESRLVCNVHWQSDILQGRFMGASTVARMRADPEFLEDVQIARAELAGIRAQGLPPGRDCATETEALAQRIPGVL